VAHFNLALLLAYRNGYLIVEVLDYSVLPCFFNVALLILTVFSFILGIEYFNLSELRNNFTQNSYDYNIFLNGVVLGHE